MPADPLSSQKGLERQKRERGINTATAETFLWYYALLFADTLQTSSGIFLNLLLEGFVPYVSKQ